jgi:hypothetical protein
MNKHFTFLRHVIIVSAISAIFALPVSAESQEDKASVTSQAIEICQNEAQNRYGQDSIKKIATKAKWSNGLKGSAVKMKIKARSNKATKYSCVVGLDKTVTFYKG